MSKWVSVKDRLPVEDALVIAAKFYETMPPELAICQLIHKQFHVWEDGIQTETEDCRFYLKLDFDVEFWTYLPEPPQ